MAKKSKTTVKLKGIIPSETRGYSPRALSQTINKLTKSMLGRKGLTHGAIVSKWHTIMGDKISVHTIPEKIVFSRDGASGGTLHLRCDSGALATELIHQEPQLLDRINTFFGYQAITRIRLNQGPLPRMQTRSRPKPTKPLDTVSAQHLTKTVACVDDPEIREALERLGKHVFSHNHDQNDK